jgi:molecular chaperone DnaJ
VRKKRDYYEILGVDKSASQDDIRDAYRRLALKYHPDRNPGDKEAEEKFKEATEAYEVLSNDEKRAQYDQFGHAGPGIGVGPTGFGFQWDISDALRTFMRDFGSFDDFFRSFADFEDFGKPDFDFFTRVREGPRRPRAYGPRKGADITYRLDITLEDAVNGLETEIEVPRMVECDKCDGKGTKPGTGPSDCPACDGRGQIRQSRQMGFTQFISITTCSKCHGEGKIIKHPCTKCHGEGMVRRRQRIAITIPPGVDAGSHLRVRGKGEAGINGGPPGDLYVVLNVKEHEFFERHGDDILCEVPITFSQAALGAELEVPTVNGTARMKIPPGTQTHTIFRLRGKGVPHLEKSGRGDQYVRVVIHTPERLSEQERRLFMELRKLSGDHVKPSESIFKKFKRSFNL